MITPTSSDPNIDGDPNAVVLVMPIPDQESTGDGIYDHNVGVWYEPEAQQWAIFNQDRAAVPAGTTFQVVVPGGPEKIVHRAEPGNIDENSTYLDDPLVNGKPEAILSVTQNWNPGGGSGTYNDHPVDVRYDTGRQRWAIYNTDDSAMPDGAAFNVAVSGVAPMTGSDAGDPTRLRSLPRSRAPKRPPRQFSPRTSSTRRTSRRLRRSTRIGTRRVRTPVETETSRTPRPGPYRP